YGQVLVGNGSGGYNLVATSSLGITTFGYPFPGDATSTRLSFNGGLATTFASTTGISASYASSTSGFFGSLSIGSLNGILKATAGAVSAAVAGTDYENPLSFGYPLVRTVNSISLAFGTTTANSWSAQQTFASLFATNASSTNATTTNLAVTSVASA